MDGNRIHPSATVAPDAVLGRDNQIGPHCVIEGGVRLGDGNRIGPGVVIHRGTTLGNANHVHAYAVLGDVPQDLAFGDQESFLVIGDGNRIREHCTLHRGTAPGSSTVVGNRTFLMVGTHVGHNCRIGDGAITANNATFGGYVEVEGGAFVSGAVQVHQFCRIGALAMVSGLTGVSKDVPPYMLCVGRPGVVRGLNVVGLRRAGMNAAARAMLKRAFVLLFRSGLTVPSGLERIERECSGPEVGHLVEFVRASRRGIFLRSGAAAGGDDL